MIDSGFYHEETICPETYRKNRWNRNQNNNSLIDRFDEWVYSVPVLNAIFTTLGLLIVLLLLPVRSFLLWRECYNRVVLHSADGLQVIVADTHKQASELTGIPVQYITRIKREHHYRGTNVQNTGYYSNGKWYQMDEQLNPYFICHPVFHYEPPEAKPFNEDLILQLTTSNELQDSRQMELVF